MQQFCQYGSVRGAAGNRRPYRDKSPAVDPELPAGGLRLCIHRRGGAITL